jgi:transposase-like protein
MRTFYAPEYMIEALRQIDSGKSVPEVASAFDIGLSTLYHAYQSALDGKFPGYKPTRTNAVRTHRTFPDEFKIEIAKRVVAGESATKVAREIKVRRPIVQHWVDQLRGAKPDPIRLKEADAAQVVQEIHTEEVELQQREAERQHKMQKRIRDVQDRVNLMIADPLIWMQQHTETKDSHWREHGFDSPYQRFPDLPYFRPLVEGFQREPVAFVAKSRNMLLSWLFTGLFTHAAMTVAGIEVRFQSQKEEKAFELVDYAKTLYDRQHPELKEAFPLAKELKLLADGELLFANGSRIVGIPGGADQIRSHHPWGLLMDEAAFMPEGLESYNNALPVCQKVVVLSSAGPGWFADTAASAV